jgi:hypothetical protein
MHDIEAEIIQTEDLSWDIHIRWYGNDVILNAFVSAKEALGELMSLYHQTHMQVNIIPFNKVKEISNA